MVGKRAQVLASTHTLGHLPSAGLPVQQRTVLDCVVVSFRGTGRHLLVQYYTLLARTVAGTQ